MSYFGTDGFRGKVNEGLTALQAFKVGEAYGSYLRTHFEQPRVYIGQDTRLSSPMLSSAVASGLSSQGVDCFLLGVTSTPMVSFLTQSSEGFSGAVMISASHNPYYDNGIKLFAETGEKLSPEVEQLIERHLDDLTKLEVLDGSKIGRLYNDQQGIEKYLALLTDTFKMDLSNYQIVLDCANGSATSTAQRAFELFGAKPVVIHNQPDGLNINRECGSTHTDSLRKKVVELKADLGFAFDGDADRMMIVNAQGQELNGDYILYILGRYLRNRGFLKGNTVVGTVMANLGLIKAFQKEEIHFVTTDVGDKYVSLGLQEHQAILGGEQSGHIILKDFINTGDGVMSALAVMSVLHHTQLDLETLSQGLTIYPQRLLNTKVKDKHNVLNDHHIKTYIQDIEESLQGNGRILVRPSGTEPLVRVMVEASTQAQCDLLCNQVVEYIQSRE